MAAFSRLAAIMPWGKAATRASGASLLARVVVPLKVSCAARVDDGAIAPGRMLSPAGVGHDGDAIDYCRRALRVCSYATAGAAVIVLSLVLICLCSRVKLTTVWSMTEPTDRNHRCSSRNHGCEETQISGRLYMIKRVAEL